MWVSTWMETMICPHVPLLILWYIVGGTEWKKRKTFQHLHRLRCNIESGKVSALPWHSVRVHVTQTLFSEPSVRTSRGLLIVTRYWPQLDPHRLCNSLDWNAHLRFTCLRYDAVQIDRPPSLKQREHFGHFFAWWWAKSFTYSETLFLLINIQGAIYFG